MVLLPHYLHKHPIRQLAFEQVHHAAFHIAIEHLLRLFHAASRFLIPDPCSLFPLF